MGSIGRYIFRTTLGAFLIVCGSITALIWIAQALRDIDLMTNQGQSILVFVGITSLIIPMLVQIIAPIALMIAVAHVLNKLSSDSELIVMNAAGMPPSALLRPFLAAGLVVSVLVATLSIYVAPWGLRALRNWATEVRADLVTNIVQPGRFTRIEAKLTLHIRERRPNGQLLGILIDDLRNAKERVTILAEHGDIVKNERGLFLVLENGSVQRHEARQPDPTVVLFDSYGFDLSSLASGPQDVKYSVRERYLWELYDPRGTETLFSARPKSNARRVSRPHHRPAVPACLRGGDLCLSRCAAHHAPESSLLAVRSDRRLGGAAPHRPLRHDRRRELADCPPASLPRARSVLRNRLFRHFARGDHRAAVLSSPTRLPRSPSASSVAPAAS